MSVHCKFIDFGTITFDGLHINVADLKKAILHQKGLGENVDFGLQITNAQTKEEYNEDTVLIPKNTSLIIARIPLAPNAAKRFQNLAQNKNPVAVNANKAESEAKHVDLVSAEQTQTIVPEMPKTEVPGDLICSVCKDLYTDPVVTLCCISYFCYDCIETALLGSTIVHECPSCQEKGTSAALLMPARILNRKANNFKEETRYIPRKKLRVERVQEVEEPVQDENNEQHAFACLLSLYIDSYFIDSE